MLHNNPHCPDDDEDDDYCPPCPDAPKDTLGSVFLFGLVGAAAAALGTWLVESIRERLGKDEDEDGDD